MNFLKKIDHYVLTNHPVLWRTKVHYFVLFSLVLGNVAALGLGYFLIKCLGAIDMNMSSMILHTLSIFGVLIWLISQARNKIKYYRFWDEVLTFLIYIICTVSLLGNLYLFEHTVTRTTANLVSVAQIDEDEFIVERDYEKLGLPYPERDVIEELAKRYQVEETLEGLYFPVEELSDRINRIYRSQLTMKIRKRSVAVCGWRATIFERNAFPLVVLLFLPTLLFLLSHGSVLMVMTIAAMCFFFTMCVRFSGISPLSIIPISFYLILGGLGMKSGGTIHRFTLLSLIPCTLMLSLGFVLLAIEAGGYYGNEEGTLILGLIAVMSITVVSSAFFIKKCFKPIA